MEKANIQEVASAIVESSIIETILTESGAALCVGNGEGYEIVSEYRAGGTIYKPLKASSPLVRSRIISLPPMPVEYLDEESLHSEVSAFIQRYVTLSTDFRSVLATYLMLSWVYDAFPEVPYLRFQGDFGSGKTRGLLVSASLAAKSFNAGGASTISPIFHILDRYQGTLILDEADFRVSDEKSEVVKILNNGNQRGFPVLRSMQNKQREYEPRAFSVYGPKIIAMRGTYDDLALESRFLSEEMNGLTRDHSVPSQLPDTMPEEAECLRGKLLMYRLRNRLRFPGEPIKIERLSDRLVQITNSLIAVAPTEEARQAVLKVAERGAASLSLERNWSFAGEVLRALLATEIAGTVLSVSEIAKTLRLQTGREFDQKVSNALVGRTLRDRLGVSLYKTRGLVTVMPGQGKQMEKLKEKYGL